MRIYRKLCSTESAFIILCVLQITIIYINVKVKIHLVTVNVLIQASDSSFSSKVMQPSASVVFQ